MTGFLCSFGASPRTRSVYQTGLAFRGSVCLCLPSAMIKGMHHHHLAKTKLLKMTGSRLEYIALYGLNDGS